MSEVDELKQREAVAQVLRSHGVFKGEHGLTGLAECAAFWEGMPYETRLEYGPGIMDYLHRSVLCAAIKAIAEIPELKQRIADLEWELMLHTSGWARAPKEAMFRATDDDGRRFWFELEPYHGSVWWAQGNSWCAFDCKVGPPTDFRTTLEPRPVRVTESTSEPKP